MGRVVNSTARPLYLRERPGTYCIGDWVGPSPFWTGAENLATVGFDPLTVQPLASHYTDWAIPAHSWIVLNKILEDCVEARNLLPVKLKYSPASSSNEINIVRKGDDGEVESYVAGSRSKYATILSTPWGSFTCCVGRLRTLVRISLRTFLVSLKGNCCRCCNHLILIPDLWRLAITNLCESARKPSLSLSCSTLILRITKKNFLSS
jgi:hypothetical protein